MFRLSYKLSLKTGGSSKGPPVLHSDTWLTHLYDGSSLTFLPSKYYP